jgi:hypothetical protein
MLRGTLLPWLRTQGLDPSEPAFALEPTARPEEIPVEGWARLADALLDARAARPQPPDGEP